METVRWSPFKQAEGLESRLRRLLEEPFVAAAPAADVYETDDEFVIELEVPGFEEKELEVEVGDRTVSVKGARTAEAEKKEKSYRLHERLESSFARRFELPAEADPGAVEASFANGVLEIRARKLEAPKARRVEIGKKD